MPIPPTGCERRSTTSAAGVASSLPAGAAPYRGSWLHGAGKTTTLLVLSGVLPLHSREVLVDGDVTKARLPGQAESFADRLDQLARDAQVTVS